MREGKTAETPTPLDAFVVWFKSLPPGDQEHLVTQLFLLGERLIFPPPDVNDRYSRFRPACFLAHIAKLGEGSGSGNAGVALMLSGLVDFTLARLGSPEHWEWMERFSNRLANRWGEMGSDELARKARENAESAELTAKRWQRTANAWIELRSNGPLSIPAIDAFVLATHPFNSSLRRK